MKKDKQYLSDKNNSIISELRQLKDEILLKEEKISDLKNDKKKLKNELSQISDLNKTRNIDEIIQTELNKLRTKSDEELKRQRKQVEAIHSNETKILRDQVELNKEQIDKLELKLKSREQQ